MALNVFNTLTKRKQLFETRDPLVCRLYACGLTVYSPMHIGHARTYSFWDFFRRYLPRAASGAVNSEDPRDWGEPPRDELERWLCRADLAAVEALCDWLVEGEPPRMPPPPGPDAVRAVKVKSLG